MGVRLVCCWVRAPKRRRMLLAAAPQRLQLADGVHTTPCRYAQGIDLGCVCGVGGGMQAVQV